MSKYLFIGGHPDDLELCCGGTISKLKQGDNQLRVFISSVFFDDFPEIYNELNEAMKFIGIEFITHLVVKPRLFDESRQIILDELVRIANDWKPDFIFTHSANDIHQDHKVIGEESLRAFKKQNLITYQAEWNTLTSEANYYVELTDEHMAKKLEAMACYKSQQHRTYFDKQFTYSRALLAGAKIGAKYAEPYRIVNMKG